MLAITCHTMRLAADTVVMLDSSPVQAQRSAHRYAEHFVNFPVLHDYLGVQRQRARRGAGHVYENLVRLNDAADAPTKRKQFAHARTSFLFSKLCKATKARSRKTSSLGWKSRVAISPLPFPAMPGTTVKPSATSVLYGDFWMLSKSCTARRR